METMEEEKNLDASSGNTASSRWNPTKEQISMLESLYKQGIRTPSAEQIQQITSRLQAFGHIEGKNVFYWFQNHKARQRQKQKQETMNYYTHLLHKTSPIFTPPPCPNVVCSPYYIPQNGIPYYPQYPKVPLPSTTGVKRKSRVDKGEKPNQIVGAAYKHDYPHEEGIINNNNNTASSNETLSLFPLHPTGILDERSGNCFGSSSAENSTSSESGVEEGLRDQPFFDFFSHHGSE